MSCDVQINRKDGYLHIRATGENSCENVRAYLMKTVEACRTIACPFVLIEEHLIGPSLDVESIHALVASQSEAALPWIKRIAYVDTNSEHIPMRMNFAAAVASERGVDVRFFLDILRAQDWLQNEIRAEKRRPHL